MKKLLSLFLILSMLLSVSLTGCKPQETPSPPSTGNEATADPTVDHADANDDGKCDDCGLSVLVTVDLFAINDLHGKICDSTSQPGVDEMTTYLKNAYKTEPHVLILSSGDMWQGSSESNLTRGMIVTEWMNELDFVSMTLGNHEYDWGEDLIKENAELAEFPLLAINVYDAETNKRADYCAPSVTVQRGGATIGIIGAIGDCHSSISGEHSGDVYFKVGNELTALVKEESKRLRDAGADFIIYSIHDGNDRSGGSTVTDSQLSSYYNPILSDGYVDIVFEGHTHQSYTQLDNKGVYHLQNGGDNKGISRAEAVINFANGNSKVQNARQVSPNEYKSLADDPIVNNLMEKYKEQVSVATKPLGMNDVNRGGDELRQLVADLYLEAGLEMWGEEYDIVLGGGYLSVRSPGYLSAGQVTFAQIQGLFPFENDLVLCSTKGQDLLNNFIHSQNSNYFVGYSDYGNTVKGNIDPNGTYYIVTDTYSSTYAPNNLTEIKRYTAGVYAQTLLADYIKAGGLTSTGGDEIAYTPIAEALQIGAGLGHNQSSPTSHYIKGTVASINNTDWGNLYVTDGAGNQIYIYGTYDSTGNIRYDAMSDPPVVGDTVVLFGQIFRYVNADTGEEKIEIKNARLISKSRA